MGQMRVMVPTVGDETLEWDPSDRESTAKAKSRFDEMKKAGHPIYQVTRKMGKQVSEFDPAAEEYIIGTPQMSGG